MDLRFNVYKVKFELLNTITIPIFEAQKINTVNIFISLDDVFYECKNSKANKEFQCCGNLATRQMVSNVLNLIAHYREWAVRNKLNVRIYSYYTLATVFDNKTYLFDYREHYNLKSSKENPDCYYVNTCIREGSGILSTICRYIDGVYTIDTRGMEPTTFPLLCATEFHQADWNFVITRDRFEFQYSYIDKFSVIYPKGDDSELLTGGNLWRHILTKEKIEGRHTDTYPDKLFPVALAVIGDKKRSLPRLKGFSWRSLVNTMDELIERNPSLDGYSYITKMIQLFENRKYDLEAISINLDLCQVDVNLITVNEISKKNIELQLVDVPDYNNLVELNKRMDMFASCPINIRFLTNVAEVKSINPFKLNYD